jgi:thiol-disulfide isomerase/thioredoxin
MAKFVNFNSRILPIGQEDNGILSRVMSAGSNVSSNTWIIIAIVILFIIVALLYYFYYISPSLKPKYNHNSEQGTNNSGNGHTAELLFFFADWCPHCKTAKPIWNDLKVEYENKTINGYKIIFTDINCSEESAEVEKLMNQYKVEGYPTIKLLKDDQIIEYDAKPSKEIIVKFLNSAL